jgi:hypothetical protein
MTSKFSISAALEKSEIEEEEKPKEKASEVLPSNHFTETDLQNEWEKFLKEVQQKDSLIFNAISFFKLRKKDENTIEITYSSDSAKTEFDKIRTEFFNHFMHKVSHFNIGVEFKNDITLKKEIVTKRKIFDKFAEINPVLKDLDHLFKFDFS